MELQNCHTCKYFKPGYVGSWDIFYDTTPSCSKDGYKLRESTVSMGCKEWESKNSNKQKKYYPSKNCYYG